jgi:hypothetical protein
MTTYTCQQCTSCEGTGAIEVPDKKGFFATIFNL